VAVSHRAHAGGSIVIDQPFLTGWLRAARRPEGGDGTQLPSWQIVSA
jgi:hypothetical protein